MMEYEYEQNVAFHNECLPAEAAGVNLPLKGAGKIVKQIFFMYPDDCDRADAESLAQELTEFIRNLLSQSEISGDSDDWHNIAVDIARKDGYCVIIATHDMDILSRMDEVIRVQDGNIIQTK